MPVKICRQVMNTGRNVAAAHTATYYIASFQRIFLPCKVLVYNML